MLNETSVVHQYAYGESGHPPPHEEQPPQTQQEQPPTQETQATAEPAAQRKTRKPRKAKNKYGGKHDPRHTPEARAKRAASLARTLAEKRKGKLSKAKAPTKRAKRQKRTYNKRANGAAPMNAADAMIAAATTGIPLDTLPPMDRPAAPRKPTGSAPRAGYRRQTDADAHATALVLIRLALDLLQR